MDQVINDRFDDPPGLVHVTDTGWVIYDEPVPVDRLAGFAFVWAALLVVMWDRVATHRRSAIPEPVA